MNNEKEKSIGLWEKTSNKGIKYYTGKGNIDGKEVTITLFLNNKTKEKQPDYNVFIRTNNNQNNTQADKEKIFADFGKETNSIKMEDLAF